MDQRSACYLHLCPAASEGSDPCLLCQVHGLRNTQPGKTRTLPGELGGNMRLCGMDMGNVNSMRFGLRKGGRVSRKTRGLGRGKNGSD